MKLAAFYHAKLSGEGIPDPDLALSIFGEQLAAVRRSGLALRLDEFHLGVLEGDALLAASLVPAKTIVHEIAREEGERSTLQLLREWLPAHPDWGVLYFHTKGVTYAGDAMAPWRRCMDKALLWNWDQCVADLVKGYESVGCHWLTPERFTMLGQSAFWAGNCWWAAAGFLRLLPPLPCGTAGNGKYYEGEAWIGRGPRRPHLRDYAPHWPMRGCLVL